MSDVHIVSSRDYRGHALERMAELLEKGAGWTLSALPSPRARLNYSFPYLSMVPPTMQHISLFTHREDTIPQKAALWHRRAAVPSLQLRIVLAPQYQAEMEGYGPTVRIVPPLDRAKFCPGAAHAGRHRAVAGVSGYVYPGGRKGEKLLQALLETSAGCIFDWRVTGAGWAVKSSRLPWDTLQTFYQDLDVYVCPSLIEGIPYGPLEALACGVPVVIPRGVGLLDELPDMDGIIRYEVGDLEDLERAMLQATSLRRGPRDELRATTERYTEEAWVQGHIAAVEKLL